MGEPVVNIRIVNSQGSDEFNCVAPKDGQSHSFRVRPDSCWIVPKEVAAIVCNDGHSGFYEHADDESTLSEIKLLASVLQDQTMRGAINAAIVSRNMLSTR